jgi:hypothetical protein
MSFVRLGALCRRLPALILSTLAVSAAAQPLTYEHYATPLSVVSYAYPEQMAVGPDGSLYAVDVQASVIWKVSNGNLGVYGGTVGNCGHRDGALSQALFCGGEGLAIDGQGNLYVSEGSYSAIRKITPDGTVSTIAGGNGAGFLDGSGSAAKFDVPTEMSFGPDGNLYVIDRSNRAIRRVTPAGVVTTLVASTSLGIMRGIAVDGGGNVFVTNDNSCVLKITSSGSISLYAGSPNQPGWTNGTTAEARFWYPGGLWIYGGDLYLADGVQMIRKITPAGMVSTFAGSGSPGDRPGTGLHPRFLSMRQLIVLGDLVYLDDGNSTIWRGVPGLTDEAQVDQHIGNWGETRTFSVSSPTSGATYSWSILTKPAGSNAALSNTTVANPTFVPDQTGTYEMKLVADNGSQHSITYVWTYAQCAVNPPEPVITADHPQWTCPGESITFSAPAGYARYQWSNGQTGQTMTTAVPYTMGIQVTGYDEHGCSTFSNYTQHVVGEPTSILPSGNYAYCGTTPGQLLTVSDAQVTSPITRQWYYRLTGGSGVDTPIAGATAATYTPVSTDFPAGGVYEIYAISNGCNGSPVRASSIIATIGGAIPEPSVTVNPATLCSGSGGSASVNDAASYTSFYWEITNGTLYDMWSSSTSFQATGADPVQLRVTVSNASGCATKTVTIPVQTANPPPAITLGTPDVCPQGTDSASVPANYAMYNWYVSNGSITAGQGTNSITFQPDSSNQPVMVSFYGQENNGCYAPPTAVAVPIRSIAAPNITLGTPDVCPQGTDTASVPANYAMYNWYVSNGSITAGQGTNSITFQPDFSNQQLTVYFYGQDASGCYTPPVQIFVPLRSIAAPNITLGTPDVCPQGTDTASVPANYAMYNWYVSNGSVTAGQGTNSITFQPDYSNQPMTVYFYGQDASACYTPPTQITVPIRTLAAPAITLGTLDVCPQGTDTASVPPNYAHYYWFVSNGNVMGGQGTNSITFSPDYSGQPLTVNLDVDDASGCSAPHATASVAIRTIPAPTITLGTPDVCPQGSDTASVPPNYAHYYWYVSNGNITGGQGTNSITFSPSLSAQPLTVNLDVDDASGCSAPHATATVAIRTIAAPTITLGTPDVCPAGTDTASVPPNYAHYYWFVNNGNVTGGQGTNSITFSPTFSNGPLTVNLDVDDASGCSAPHATASVAIRTIAAPTITLGTPDVCPAGTDTASVPPDYAHYYWFVNNGNVTGGQGTNSITFSPTSNEPMTVNLDVDDASGCSAPHATATVAIHTLTAPVVTASGPTTFCAGGSVTLTAPEGFASYNWSNGATTQSITVSTSGSYWVGVSDGSGCSAQSDPIVVTVSPQPPPATITASGPTTFCAGGSVTLTASSGASYLWSNGATTQSISVGANGSCSVTVTDGNGCSAASEATIVTVNPPPTATVTTGGPTTFCAGGAVTLTASSGASYAWSNGATTQSISVSSSGNYSVTITDANGCSATSAATGVTVNPLPSATISAGGPTTFCSGGSVTLTASSGASYAWSNSATTQSISVSSSGNYSVTITDANGCSATSAATGVTVNPLPSATISAGGPTTFCAGGSVTLTASSGASYAWSTGATTQSISVSSSGNYSVTITDANGCSATSAATGVTVNPLPSATISAGGPTTFCAGGSVTLTASSGASYLWSTGATTQSITVNSSGNYTVTVADANCSATSAATSVTVNSPLSTTITTGGPTTFCAGGSVTLTASSGASYAWSTGATTQSITVTSGSNYHVTVTDANGCSSTSADTAVTVNTPLATITPSGPTTFCAGGSVTLTANEGASYSWSNGATTRSIAVNATNDFTVTVTDANGCSSQSAQTSVTVQPLPAPTINPAGSVAICAGTTATLTASAASSWLWSNGATTQAITVGAGNYSVTVADVNGCSATSAATAVTTKARPTAAVSGGATICAGGSATVTATLTGVVPFSVTWSDGNVQNVGSGTTAVRSVSPSSTTTYTVTSVTDANCSGTSSGSATVTVNTLPAFAQPPNQTIPKNTKATLTVNPTGTAPFTYEWFKAAYPSATNKVATTQTYVTPNLGHGTYTYWVRVTNTCGQRSSATITITSN